MGTTCKAECLGLPRSNIHKQHHFKLQVRLSQFLPVQKLWKSHPGLFVGLPNHRKETCTASMALLSVQPLCQRAAQSLDLLQARDLFFSFGNLSHLRHFLPEQPHLVALKTCIEDIPCHTSASILARGMFLQPLVCSCSFPSHLDIHEVEVDLKAVMPNWAGFPQLWWKV